VELVLVLTLRVRAGQTTELPQLTAIQGPYSRGLTWPVVTLGVIAAVLLALGLVFPYIEMWKHNGRVVGLSFRFLAIDFAGAFFSLMALAAQRTFDVLGGVSYISVMLLEIGIVFFHLLWLWRTRQVRRAAKDCGKEYDEYVNSMEIGPHTAKRTFVPIDSVPQWPKTARVLAILSALRNTPIDNEKGDIEATGAREVENVQKWPENAHDSAVMAAMSQPQLSGITPPDAVTPRSSHHGSVSLARVFPRDSLASALQNEPRDTPGTSRNEQESGPPPVLRKKDQDMVAVEGSAEVSDSSMEHSGSRTEN
jgi:hypothetical protein